ncbi:agmatine deiminase family protein [uncultured Mameliella sp.]|uniref:agmatine deiminase family protein n=1 Tax=uncultured Mameliella sp. TaxID=1447087 RepID=UPI00262F7A61|nr:agmatine deiminase family protein [uncultured Mameliella sp.]
MGRARCLVPDYALPDALCVPYWRFDVREALEAVARTAARHCGVILITPDPASARDFIATVDHPDHFGIVSGAFDSPWLRDHAPIAVREGDSIQLVRPARPEGDRKHDLSLFETILPGAEEVTRHIVAGGNLVGGPGGSGFSTTDILRENGLDEPEALVETGRQLGLDHWHFLPPFPDDISAHADCMLRFLGPGLCAICARDDTPEAREVSAEIRARVAETCPEVAILALPCAATEAFNSPLNWIQLGRCLLLPHFDHADPLTATRTQLLREAGFDPVPIPAMTEGLGGALHCLTASIFAAGP